MRQFAEVYSVISLFLVVLTIFVTVAYFFPDVDFFKQNMYLFDILNKFLFITLFLQFVLSTFALIDQTQKIDIVIYPPKFPINDFGDFYGVTNSIDEDEESIQVFFLKKGFSKITLDDITINFPDCGELSLEITSFLSPHVNKAVSSFKSKDDIFDNQKTVSSIKGKEEIFNNQKVVINKEVNYLSANVYKFRIYNKKYYKLTDNKFTVTVSYTVFLFHLKVLHRIKSETVEIGF